MIRTVEINSPIVTPDSIKKMRIESERQAMLGNLVQIIADKMIKPYMVIDVCGPDKYTLRDVKQLVRVVQDTDIEKFDHEKYNQQQASKTAERQNPELAGPTVDVGSALPARAVSKRKQSSNIGNTVSKKDRGLSKKRVKLADDIEKLQ